MNPNEFVDFYKQSGGSFTSPPTNPFKKEWKRIKEDIEPHFMGQVPPALLEAFPNEDGEIKKYRLNTYQAKTESPIVKAINELTRLITGSKYSVYFDSEKMQDWYENSDFAGERFVYYFFKKIIPYRILDPNAVALVDLSYVPETAAEQVEIDMTIISSDRVIFYDNEYPLLIYKGETKKKYTSTIEYAFNEVYKVVTDEFYGRVLPVQGNYNYNPEFDIEIQSGFFLRIDYIHGLGFVPFSVLGGRPVPKYDRYGNQYIVYKSDFSAAVPYLNDAAIFDNQHRSVMLARCFPVTFIEGVTCQSCHGQGYTYDEATDEKHTCGTCKGTGKTPYLSPLAGYYIAPAPTRVGDAVGSGTTPDPIRFFNPETATIEMTSKEAKHALEKAENVLNINRSLKQAQSGVAKELDREPEYIEVGKMSGELFNMLHHTLYSVQGLLFLDIRSEVSLSAPISFDLKNESELMAEFAQTQNGMPASVRYDAFLSFVAQRFSTDYTARRLAEIAVDYSVWVLYTTDERIKLLASGGISRADNIRANYAFETVKNLYYSGDLALDLSTSEYKTIIDNALQEKVTELSSLGVFGDVEDLDSEEDSEL
jgi:hypothetical protein